MRRLQQKRTQYRSVSMPTRSSKSANESSISSHTSSSLRFRIPAFAANSSASRSMPPCKCARKKSRDNRGIHTSKLFTAVIQAIKFLHVFKKLGCNLQNTRTHSVKPSSCTLTGYLMRRPLPDRSYNTHSCASRTTEALV